MSTLKKITLTVIGTIAISCQYAQAKPEMNCIGIGGETLFVLRSQMDLDKSMESRANDVYDRIRYVLNNPNLRSADIKVRRLGDYGYKIVANNELIVPIGPKEAEAHGMTMQGLANEWVTHLRSVLPKLTARPDLLATSYKNIPHTSVRGRQ